MTWLFTTDDKAAVVSFSSGNSSNVFSTLGIAFARYLLIGCWKNLIDTLSTPLTGRMAGSSKGLAFILGAEGAKEQNQKEKDSICVSLDGLRRAARLSCALGTAAWGMAWQTRKLGWELSLKEFGTKKCSILLQFCIGMWIVGIRIECPAA